jgi:hypothetical protein
MGYGIELRRTDGTAQMLDDYPNFCLRDSGTFVPGTSPNHTLRLPTQTANSLIVIQPILPSAPSNGGVDTGKFVWPFYAINPGNIRFENIQASGLRYWGFDTGGVGSANYGLRIRNPSTGALQYSTQDLPLKIHATYNLADYPLIQSESGSYYGAIGGLTQGDYGILAPTYSGGSYQWTVTFSGGGTGGGGPMGVGFGWWGDTLYFKETNRGHLVNSYTTWGYTHPTGIFHVVDLRGIPLGSGDGIP